MSDQEFEAAKKAWLEACDEVKKATDEYSAQLFHTEGETVDEMERKLRAVDQLGRELKRVRNKQDHARGRLAGLLEIRQRERRRD
jgi:hypothetical protein